MPKLDFHKQSLAHAPRFARNAYQAESAGG